MTSEASASGDAQDVLRVVLVDDAREVRFMLRQALELDGRFEVAAEAGNGAEGVSAVQAHQPDVVLLDLAMPVMDGLQALPLIRERAPAAVVVVLSGFDARTVAPEAIRRGAAAYLEKGTALTVLADRLVELCAAEPLVN